MKVAQQENTHRPTAKADETVRISRLAARFGSGNATVGVVGMGYVGQPLAITAHQKGFRVIGFDIDADRVTALNRGHSTIRTIPDAKIATMLLDRRFRASADLDEISEADVVIICVPTPLNKFR